MGSWSGADVRRVAADWVWVPDGSRRVDRDYRLIGYPSWTSIAPQVSAVDSDRPAAAIADEAAAQARSWEADKLGWWINAATRPADLVQELRSRGAEHADTVDVLALNLDRELPDFGPMPGISAERVTTVEQFRDADVVNVAVWGQEPLSEERLREQVTNETPTGDIRVIARLDGRPVASGGCTVVDGVARLWGAATVEAARGRGAYRAVLGLRLRLARDAGATLALVKGRAGTSAPILKRIGFTEYGQEHIYELPLN